MSDRSPGALAVYHCIVIAIAGITLAGCSNNEPASVENSKSRRLELKLVDRAQFDATIARLQGRVVLVDCWASWCLPCVAQLSHTMELARRHEADGLTVVTLSLDEPDTTEGVHGSLAGAGADDVGENALHMQSYFGSSPRSIEEFAITGGALPHYKLYDRSGELRRTFALDPSAERQFTTTDIDEAVAQLLAE